MVLIVDDQRDCGLPLQRLLNVAGHVAVWVAGGAEALDMLRVCKPALVILDVNMPDMDGLAVLRAMKAHEEWKDIKVLMYSADTDPLTRVEAKRVGAVAFLLKGSINCDELVERVRELVNDRAGGLNEPWS